MMTFKKIFSVVLVLIGVLILGSSYYIKNQVAKGEIQILDAEKKLDTGKTLFSINPISKEIGSQLTKFADRKIAEGRDQIEYYTNLGKNLLIVGIVFVFVGSSMFVFYARRK